MMDRRLRYSIILVEVTALPLLFLSLLMVVTGYTLIYPETMPALTFGAINYGTAHRLHTDPVIRTCFTVLAVLHSIGGMFILIEKHAGRPIIKKLIETLILIILVYMGSIVLVIEILTQLR